MGTNAKETATRKVIGRFARTLLATTCLTAASSGAAMATTIYPPFPNGENPVVFSPFTVLPVDPGNPGTTIVGVTQVDHDAYFELTGLGPGMFTFSAALNPGSIGSDTFFFCPTETLNPLSSAICTSEGTVSSSTPIIPFSMAVPGNGNLIVESHFNESANSYTVTVQAPGLQTPEPSTIATAGLGLATLVTLSRKKR